MKKLISLILAVAMLVSLVAVNVSAAVPTGVPSQKVTLFKQDYEAATNNADLKAPYGGNNANGRGLVSVQAETEGSSNTVASLTLNPDQTTYNFISVPSSTITDIQKDVFTVELDVKPLVANAAGIEVGIRAPYHKNLTNLQNGISAHIGYNVLKVNEWNHIILDVDFSKFRAGTATCGAEANSGIKARVKAESASVYTTLEYGNWTNNVRVRVNDDYTFPYRPIGADNGSAAFAIGVVNRGGGTNWSSVNHLIDNIEISYMSDAVAYPNGGVIATQDYEDDTNTILSSTHNGQGTATKTTENGNNCMSLKANADGNALLVISNNANITHQDFAVTVDVKCVTPGSAFVVEAYRNKVAESYACFVWSAGMETGKWYRYKFAAGNVVARKDLSDPDAEWITIPAANGNDSATASVTTATPKHRVSVGNSGLDNAIRIGMRNTIYDTGATLANTEYLVDNITIAKETSYSIPAVVSESGKVGATINVDAVRKATTAGTMTTVLGVYDSTGMLVDVDFETPTMNAGEVLGVDLLVNQDVPAGGSAKIFVWDSFANGAPLLATPIDLTAEL
ncbi:MAG: hypothetical protein IKW64_04190 [Clostridia bacterium]|nr:hypothetical protein [Clostridia bacterium]